MADEKVTNLGRPKRLASLPRFLSSQVRAKQEIRKKLKKVRFLLCYFIVLIISVDFVQSMPVVEGRIFVYDLIFI